MRIEEERIRIMQEQMVQESELKQRSYEYLKIVRNEEFLCRGVSEHAALKWV